MSATRRERIERAIEYCEQNVKSNRADLINLLLELGYIIVVVVLILLAYFYSELAGLLTTLGVGGLSIAGQAKATKDLIKAYFSDPQSLLKSLKVIRTKLELCDEDDNACLDRVEQLLFSFLDYIDSLAKKED